MSADKQLIYQGSLISVNKERVELRENGHTWFDIVNHPGGVVIAAINKRQEICLLRQWRHAIGQTIWELPAGCLEPDESPLACAQRELEEEAGVIAADWQSLGEVCSTPGFCNEILHLYAARTLSAGVIKLDDAEQLEAHWLPVAQVIKMAKSGEVFDAKTLAVLFRLD